MKHVKTDVINILNINISDYSVFFSQGNRVIFKTGKKNNEPEENDFGEEIVDEDKGRDIDSIKFKTNEEADKARDRIFYTLGLKSPQNIYLDLTTLDSEIEPSEYLDLTIMQIAEKFKTDPRYLRVVDIATNYVDLKDADVDDVEAEKKEDI